MLLKCKCSKPGAFQLTRDNIVSTPQKGILMSKCTVEKCFNSRFQELEQCAFHCNGKDVIRKGYDPTTYAEDFYKLFSEYIIEEVGSDINSKIIIFINTLY